MNGQQAKREHFGVLPLNYYAKQRWDSNPRHPD